MASNPSPDAAPSLTEHLAEVAAVHAEAYAEIDAAVDRAWKRLEGERSHSEAMAPTKQPQTRDDHVGTPDHNKTLPR